MPKAPMEEAEFLEKKEQIIDIAAEIIMEQGYQGLSMRNIGTKIGMTAANLYNYYSNKDELNIAIRARAGKILYHDLESAYHKGETISEKIAVMLDAYIGFGTLKANYYMILFDMRAPKYADYVGSPLEALALKEKESTEQSLGLMQQCIGELKDAGYHLPDDTDAFLIMIWGQIHGLVSLYNNKLISEINHSPEKTLKHATTLINEMLFNFISKPDY